jgi:hypothetical protein
MLRAVYPDTEADFSQEAKAEAYKWIEQRLGR